MSLLRRIEKGTSKEGSRDDSEARRRQEAKEKVRSRINEAFRNRNSVELDLSQCMLTELPIGVILLSNLTSLNLSGNEIASLPSEISQLVNLNSLNLSDNNLTSLPAEIGQLVNLNSLNLSGNKLVYLPEDIGNLVNLTSLNLSRNQLTTLLSLPMQIDQLVKLASLDLSRNQFTKIPLKVCRIVSLTSLDLSSNQLSALPPEIGLLVNLIALNLSNNKLSSLPSQFGHLVNLASLNLGANQLKTLSAEFCKLIKLTSLGLFFNQLKALPAEFCKLVNLTLLNLAGNQLSSLPMEIGQLTRLVSLNISSNELNSLPVTFGNLFVLEELNIASNKFSELPFQIFQNRKLKMLCAYGNYISSISPLIAKLTSLEGLYLGRDVDDWFYSSGLVENIIESLPQELQQLKYLKELSLNNNQLPIPPEILEKTDQSKAILDYYFSRLKKPLNECKVLVVGQGSVGKTSLIHRLLENKYNPKENKTEGIDIHHFDFRALGITYGINVWDFGGQEIMHATHQFFLTKRSLYLLVLDSRLTQEENRVEYWLKMIQSFGGESPILVVGNKTDQHPLDIDQSGLQKKYPNIVKFVKTSAATGVGMDELRSAIAMQIHNLPHVRDALPEAWIKIKKQLEKLRSNNNFIADNDFLSLCNQNEVTGEGSQDLLIGFMHDLGVILYFQDDPRLVRLGILNPQWVTNGVYKILNSPSLFQNKGVLTIPMLNEILNIPGYQRSERMFIVDMMKKFELCYDIEADKKFLVPDLLPKDEPFTGDWDDALAFQYHYAVLPSSIITRFIVQMNEYGQKALWRSGVVLKNESNTALVKADVEDKKIFIWVSGDQYTRRDFLSTIRSVLGAINKRITSLEVREKVPVPGHADVAVDFQHLLVLEQKGMNEYLPEGMTELVSVRQLLNGVASEEDRRQANYLVINGNVDHSTITVGDRNKIDRRE